MLMLLFSARRARALCVVAAVAVVALPVAPASAVGVSTEVPAVAPAVASGDRGLYGSADPSFDGVYRQSWAIVGLRSVGSSVPARAVRWLTSQQCGNGGFQSYRADTSAPCAVSNAASFSGPDSNSTAMAVMALRSVGQRSRADRAVRYLSGLQGPDGGFSFYAGGDSDANSTGLAVAALRGSPQTAATKQRITRATGWLRSVQRRCGAAPQQGLVPFQAGGPANFLASAQAALGLSTTLPARARATKADALVCRNDAQVGSVSTRNALLWGTAQALRTGGGVVANQFGSGSDLTATAQMVIALGSAKQYPATVRTAVRVLKRSAASYTGPAGQANPAAVGTLLVLADVTPNTAPRSFGGVDLVATLRGTLR
jgi:hypothetical protein